MLARCRAVLMNFQDSKLSVQKLSTTAEIELWVCTQANRIHLLFFFLLLYAEFSFPVTARKTLL